jgi:hypothetical protein
MFGRKKTYEYKIFLEKEKNIITTTDLTLLNSGVTFCDKNLIIFMPFKWIKKITREEIKIIHNKLNTNFAINATDNNNSFWEK